MSIVTPDIIQERGKQDASRHREKQRDAIKKKIPEIIAEESIITGKKGKIIRIPIRKIEIPHFRPGKGDDGGYGVGQGSGDPGDVIGRRPQPNGQQPGSAGQEPGVDYIETEIAIEEIVAMMMEDLGLPKLDEKQTKQILVDVGWKIAGRTDYGPPPLMDVKATALEGFKRFWAFLTYLEKETGRDQLACYSALKQCQGLIKDALELLKDPNYRGTETEVVQFTMPQTSDLRYYNFERDQRPESQAVVLAMMDISGSMDTDKKYFARSMLFWMVEFLRRLYDRVEIRFITHHTEAKIVDEDSFFKTGESGGTRVASAYELALSLIETEYPPSSWNIYPFHFSDGDDFEPSAALTAVRKLLDKGVNMFGYAQVNPDGPDEKFFATSSGDLLTMFITELQLTKMRVHTGLLLATGSDDVPFVGVRVTRKEQLFPAIKEFLKKDRWKGVRR